MRISLILKRIHVLILSCLIFGTFQAAKAQYKIPASESEDSDKIMSKAYWSIWNDEAQAKIDADIEANRKANAEFNLEGAVEGSEVTAEQISHDFIFGAHTFNFDQLGEDTLNLKYKDLFGSLFNSGTVAFYWARFEPQKGNMRYKPTNEDTADFWNLCETPKTVKHWRRPPADIVVDFLKSRGVRVHGHTIVWGNRAWQMPVWALEYCAKNAESDDLKNIVAKPPVDGNKIKGEVYSKAYKEMSAEDFERRFPKFLKNLQKLFDERLNDLASHYKDKIDSWDIVNGSAIDFASNRLEEGKAFCKSTYGIMPGDYPYKALKSAEKAFPKNVKLNINDYWIKEGYAELIKNLEKRGCKIDIVGMQMHMFKPSQTLDIAEGRNPNHKLGWRPDQIDQTLKNIDLGYPIHMSEITVTAPDATEKGRIMQAVIARNLYRKWFSVKPVMGITWWNVVDDCGAPGEPSFSGLFTRAMNPKPAFYALNTLINKDWKTSLNLKADKNGSVKFRGFRGKYRLCWKDSSGKERSKIVNVK